MRVAVYGTLRGGQPNWRHYLRGRSEYVGKYRVAGFELRAPNPYSFPFALTGDGEITVDVFEVGADVLKDLDRLEGYPRMYNRKAVEIGGADAWIYFSENEGHRTLNLIDSGDWLSYKKEYPYENA